MTAFGGDRIVGGFGAVRRASSTASLLGSTIPRLEHARDESFHVAATPLINGGREDKKEKAGVDKPCEP